MTHDLDKRRRWLALIVLCLGMLMIVPDTTIVNVALPSIRSDIGFTESSLVWVVNAYMQTFGGFLLLSGRLGDLFGHRSLFHIGITVFTLPLGGLGDDHATPAIRTWMGGASAARQRRRRRDRPVSLSGRAARGLGRWSRRARHWRAAIVADVMDVDEEATDELVARQRHDFLPLASLAAVVLQAQMT